MTVAWANGYKNSALRKRRIEVNKLVRCGFSTTEIAEKLNVSRRIVQSDIEYARKKRTEVKVVTKYDVCED